MNCRGGDPLRRRQNKVWTLRYRRSGFFHTLVWDRNSLVMAAGSGGLNTASSNFSPACALWMKSDRGVKVLRSR